MRGVLTWLVHWARCAGTRDFCPASVACSQPSAKYVFPHCALFQFICPHRQASLAGSRAGSPVSQYVSLGVAMLLFTIEEGRV
jgi:hypothetical protein